MAYPRHGRHTSRAAMEPETALPLPRGVRQVGSKGKFQSQIYWRHKLRHIGVFNSRGDASDAYLAMKKILELFDTSRSGIGDRTLDVMFDAAKKSVRESYRGFVADKRDLPSGVRILPSGISLSSSVSTNGVRSR
jgi:hypothetical protein